MPVAASVFLGVLSVAYGGFLHGGSGSVLHGGIAVHAAPAAVAYRTAAVAAPVATYGAGLGFGHTIAAAPAVHYKTFLNGGAGLGFGAAAPHVKIISHVKK
ncbi:hypothetical protein HPB50_025883 [Hyalomma asiaticum]|uniref:Uncharacterized protein n=1 Tax=Hyalomma asiaticum TaxID=266040 RepID=A0ACB7TC84_HYAAI|nr:hypothetical protein HPB50_025883 [Hyalomma asiaticum]